MQRETLTWAKNKKIETVKKKLFTGLEKTGKLLFVIKTNGGVYSNGS